MNDLKKLIKELTSISAPSGYEHIATNHILNCISKSGICTNIEVDTLGNIYFKKQGKKEKTLMLVAHYDEIGLAVKFIDECGYIYFTAIGGIDTNILRGQKVIITHGDTQIHGVVGAIPIHISSHQKRGGNTDSEIGDLWIDIGANCKNDAEQLVSIGDPITFFPNFSELPNDLFTTKSIDNRAGLATLLYVYRKIQETETDYTIFFVASAQEELGLRGVKTAAYSITPNVCITIDTTHATDYSAINKRKHGYIGLGNGAVIPKGPNFNFLLQQELCDIANINHIKHQIESISGHSGTDAAEAQLSKGGCETGLISIPCRYMHTPVEIASVNDIKSVIEILLNYCKKQIT